ncbi:MAG TPA: hypothetical protein VJQ26_06190 [Ktedonobacteraceae bacterium]|nr:hypothetical protein [Ktedonobacteraceae bacterium]
MKRCPRGSTTDPAHGVSIIAQAVHLTSTALRVSAYRVHSPSTPLRGPAHGVCVTSQAVQITFSR